MGRGQSWNANEDLFLAKSFVCISHDPAARADQKAKVFWDRVQKQFCVFVPDSKRTAQALSSRWYDIQAETNKFIGHYNLVCSKPKSSFEQEDYIRAELQLHEETEKKPFEHRLVWEYLQKEVPKFEESLTPSSNRVKYITVY